MFPSCGARRALPHPWCFAVLHVQSGSRRGRARVDPFWECWCPAAPHVCFAIPVKETTKGGEGWF